MTKVAKLDAQGRLIGVENTSARRAQDRIVVNPGIDLPMDGSYWWDPDARAFVALSSIESLLPAASPVPPLYATFLALRALVRGEPIPDEVREYVEWYEAAGGEARTDRRDRTTRAIAVALRALVRGEPMPPEVHEFVAWYDQQERPRAERRTGAVKRLLRAPRR